MGHNPQHFFLYESFQIGRNKLPLVQASILPSESVKGIRKYTLMAMEEHLHMANTASDDDNIQ